jgi:hypothetical protein
MLLRLDHLVIAVRDPDAAAAELERRVGLACTGGGRHPLWGTHNRLAWFGDTYAELIGIFDPSLTANGAVSRAVASALATRGEGLVTYAVATDDADGDLARLHLAGSDLGDVEARSRTRPDGEVVRWRAAFPPALGPASPPFIVEHEDVGAEWGAAARAARASLVHPVGGVATVTGLTLPVRDPGGVAAAYLASVGLAFRGDPATATIGAQAVTLAAGDPDGDPATIHLRIDPARAFDVEALGVRWRAG